MEFMPDEECQNKDLELKGSDDQFNVCCLLSQLHNMLHNKLAVLMYQVLCSILYINYHSNFDVSMMWIQILHFNGGKSFVQDPRSDQKKDLNSLRSSTLLIYSLNYNCLYIDHSKKWYD